MSDQFEDISTESGPKSRRKVKESYLSSLGSRIKLESSQDHDETEVFDQGHLPKVKLEEDMDAFSETGIRDPTTPVSKKSAVEDDPFDTCLEMGYFSLTASSDNFELLSTSKENDVNTSTSVRPEMIEVKIVSSHDIRKCPSESIIPLVVKSDIGFDDVHEGYDERIKEIHTNNSINEESITSICQECRLQIKKCLVQNDFAGLEIDLDSVPYFNGNIGNVKCKGCNGKRCDASLLLGLLKFCDEVIRIKECIAIVHPSDDNRLDVATKNQSHSEVFEIYITVTFPIWFWRDPDQNGRRSIHPDDTKKANKIKHLHPGTQLLLSLIKCDWINLEDRLAFIQKISKLHVDEFSPSQIQSSTLFPSVMTFDALYESIRGCNRWNATMTNERSDDFESRNEPSRELQSLPKELLQTHLASFLRASSLYNLRCTCKHLFHTLASVVPGLRPSIQLYKHQVASLKWMRQREMEKINESGCFMDYANVGMTYGLDYHRAVSGGYSVRLEIRTCSLLDVVSGRYSIAAYTIDTSTSPELNVRLEQLTGRQVLEDTDNSSLAKRVSKTSRQVARGGLLCDDPGLGKTITVVSLILQTFGLSTAKSKSESDNRNSGTNDETEMEPDNLSDKIFKAYWNEEVMPTYRTPVLLRLLNDLGKIDRSSVISFNLMKMKTMVDKGLIGVDFDVFEKSVEKMIQESVRLAISNGRVHQASMLDDFINHFHSLVSDMKQNQMRSARKFFSSTKSKPDSTVASLVEKDKHQRLLNSLEPSAATLLVIPAVLMDHWESQIKAHVDFKYCADSKKEFLVFHYHGQGPSETMTVAEAEKLCTKVKSHLPLVFLDKSGTRELPSPKFLSMFKIVVTTTNRFTYEWKNGSFQTELEKYQNNEKSNRDGCDDNGIYTTTDACPLLKVHWLRMVVDEGHSMGNSTRNSTIQFASWIQAERRWAMTGTPTKQNEVHLGQVHNLLSFLQHGFFTSKNNGLEWWRKEIKKGWDKGELVAFFRVCSLMNFLMKRHTKRDIVELEQPRFSETMISMSFVEATTYNTLVTGVQSNILITSMRSKTSGLQDSLLHQSQAKHARLALANIRRVCVGWANVVPTLLEKHKEKTIEMAMENGLDDNDIEKIRGFLQRTENEEVSECACCGIQLSILLLMPCCAGLLCTQCMTTDGNTCLICEEPFDPDDFQRFQPGFEMEWKSNLRKSTFVIPENHNLTTVAPSVSVPSESSSVRVNPPERRRTRRMGDGHECVYDMYFPDGRCMYCQEEHSPCNLLNNDEQCFTCYRRSENCPDRESKASYLVKRLVDLHNDSKARTLSFSPRCSGKQRDLKVIVFSQFRSALNVVGDRIIKKFGNACVAEYFGKYRSKELRRFKHVTECFCLLLTRDGSEGLDLSFVTNIIFIEQIYDKSLEDQAVARAWRMGATGHVDVETLIADNSVEVNMLKFNKETSKSNEGLAVSAEEHPDKVPGGGAEKQRVKSLLQSLSLIKDYQPIKHEVVAEIPTAVRNVDIKRDRKVQFQLPSDD